ncbi:MAG: BON domain-containing protein [Candidatus Binataceae bacterium]
MTTQFKSPMRGAIGILGIAAACLAIATATASAQQPGIPSLEAAGTPAATVDSKTSQEEHVHSATTHTYSSETARANDALLITEVKSALAKSGVTANQAVVVDCDHGTVTLAGAVASASAAHQAVEIASAVQGVKGVNSKLTW